MEHIRYNVISLILFSIFSYSCSNLNLTINHPKYSGDCTKKQIEDGKCFSASAIREYCLSTENVFDSLCTTTDGVVETLSVKINGVVDTISISSFLEKSVVLDTAAETTTISMKLPTGSYYILLLENDSLYINTNGEYGTRMVCGAYINPTDSTKFGVVNVSFWDWLFGSIDINIKAQLLN